MFAAGFIVSILFMLMADLYTYKAVKTLWPARWVKYLYWSISVIFFIVLLIAFISDEKSWDQALKTAIAGFFTVVYFPKAIVALFLLIEDFTRIIRGAYRYFKRKVRKEDSEQYFTPISRKKFLSRLALMVGSVPAAAMLHGIAFNAYRYQVRQVPLKIPNIPESLKGLKILQISDLHTGSFLTKEPLYRAVDMINEQEADLVFFTGDLVNYVAKEALDFEPIFSRIKAKYGVYSILGNHDYGDYFRWETPQKKVENMELLKSIHQSFNWDLLLNENRVIEIEGKKLAVIGTENWSSHKFFHNYGDLGKAYSGCEDCDVKLLMAHDPSIWKSEVQTKFPDIHATFSGHTHGFQFGVNIPGFKWSPIQYVYDEWFGLYGDSGSYLYVNPGLGYIRYPGRVGFLPEITVFTLA